MSRERLLIQALLAVGLDRAARLRRDDERGGCEPVVQRVQNLPRLRRVENSQFNAVCAGDDLRGERRPTHACENDVVDTVRVQQVSRSS